MAAKYAGHETASTVLSTELNSLADGANKITGTALSNDAATTERHLFASFSLSIAATSTRTGSSVHMYILPEVDGSFVAGGDSLDPEQGYVGSFNFDLTTSALRPFFFTNKPTNLKNHFFAVFSKGCSSPGK